jgi:hypothetical protein
MTTATGRQPVDLSSDRETRWELLRSLGAALVTPPPDNGRVLDALGLPLQSGAEHTDAFVLSAPPHAAIHLGPEGKLGGEGLDRVAGFWRALGLRPPQDADHLGVLLMLYAELGEAEDHAAARRLRDRLRLARIALLYEHIGCWAPGYLASISAFGTASVASWAALVQDAVREELADVTAYEVLPLALRAAPPALSADTSPDELLDWLLVPVRAGFVLTRHDLAQCAGATGVGLRRGERRFILKAMLEQDPRATMRWLTGHARRWSKVHAGDGADAVAVWWSQRAVGSAEALDWLIASSPGLDVPTT